MTATASGRAKFTWMEGSITSRLRRLTGFEKRMGPLDSARLPGYISNGSDDLNSTGVERRWLRVGDSICDNIEFSIVNNVLHSILNLLKRKRDERSRNQSYGS